MQMVRQFMVAIRLSLSSLPGRIGPALVIVASLTCVVGVMLSLLAVGEGLRRAYLGAGDSRRALILSPGALKESDSRLSDALVGRILPRMRPDWMTDAELSAGVRLAKQATQERGGTRLRGLGSQGVAMRPRLRLVEGQFPRPDMREVMAGVTAARKFSGLSVGQNIRLPGGIWRVTGHFVTDDTLDGDLVTSAAALHAALQRTSYDAVHVELPSAAAMHDLRDRLRNLPVAVIAQDTYYRRLWDAVPNTPYYVAYGLGLLIAMGAVSGTMHTMQVTVGARAREIAVLRAVGFSALPVAASVVAEAMLLACIGAMIGVLIDWFLLDGYAYNGGMEGGVFRIAVTRGLLLVALIWALGIALIGAMIPAWNVARAQVVDALGAD